MRDDGVVIASNACFLVDMLGKKLCNALFRVFVAATDIDLEEKIKTVCPRFVFIEDCFHGHGTDVFIQGMVRRNRKLRIVVWAASELKPVTAARYIAAGADSFFSLRDTGENIETVLFAIAVGKHYRPAGVEAVLERGNAFPLVGEKLTRREIEIFRLSISGKKNREICKIMSLSIHTVKYHKTNIYRKCGGETPVDILRNGLKKGIIHEEDL